MSDNDGDLYKILAKAAESFDGELWAQHYLRAVRQFPPVVVTEEYMTTWFANAIMAGYDAGYNAGLAAGKKEASDAWKIVLGGDRSFEDVLKASQAKINSLHELYEEEGEE